MKLSEALRLCANDLLETEPDVTIEQVVLCAEARYPNVIYDEQARLVRNAAMSEAKKILGQLSEDEDDRGQLSLPGLDLPTVLGVQDTNGDYRYIRTDKATWADIIAAESLREINVARAQMKLDRFREARGALAPFMETNPTVTVAEALRKMRDTGTEAA